MSYQQEIAGTIFSARTVHMVHPLRSWLYVTINTPL